MSTNTFAVPPYQREFAWTADEYQEFWSDISRSLDADSYFLGLIILTTDSGARKQVVDGQQRLLSLTLLAAALYHEALANDRSVLADRIQADFLRAIEYETEGTTPRIVLSDPADNQSLREIVAGERPHVSTGGDEAATYSRRLYEASDFLSGSLHADLASDPFRRLGAWTDFLTNRLLFAVFVHPDAASAYRVFEVINTRGRELTTADLLKNFVLSETPASQREAMYSRWRAISQPVTAFGQYVFVQYIRHVVTTRAGHILPKDLFDYIAGRRTQSTDAYPPSPDELVELLETNRDLYLQMLDPAAEGPADSRSLQVFEALNDLNVIAVRPLLLAINSTPNREEGMERVLELVIRRIVVGNLGTGNVERRFGEAALAVTRGRSWEAALRALDDLNPAREDFVPQLSRRSLNRGILQFMRRSLIQGTKTPEPEGFLHFIRPRQGWSWPGFNDEALTYWGSTLGNTFLATQERRPQGASSWEGVRQNLLPLAVGGELVEMVAARPRWDANVVEELGRDLAERTADIWYADARRA